MNDPMPGNGPMPGNDPLPASEPWECQPGEPTLWFARFEAYRLQGPDRSLLAAVNAHRQARNKQQSRSVPQAWAKNARRWRWHDRAEAWDQLRRREARQAHAQAVEEMNNRHVQEGRALQSKAIQGLKSLDVSLLSPAHLLRFCTEAAKLERLALGEPQPVDEVSPMNQADAVDSFSVEDVVRADRELEEFENANSSKRGDEAAAADGSAQVP